MATTQILSYRFRVKDATTGKHLARHARACNSVWNFCVATQREAERRYKAGKTVRWPSAFDLINLCSGSSSLLGIHSDTIAAICRQFAASRDTKRKCPRFRASFGPKRALGWVPVVPRAVQVDGPQMTYLKRRIRAIHAKIANARKHQLHEATTRIVRENALIVIGNVSSTKLVKTRMAKSVLDASWGMLRSQLAYKARRYGARLIVVNEAWTSQTCSRCGIIPDSSPKGMGALGIRDWTCSCGAEHDRDLNAAKNILRLGLERQAPAEEIPALRDGEDVIQILPR